MFIERRVQPHPKLRRSGIHTQRLPLINTVALARWELMADVGLSRFNGFGRAGKLLKQLVGRPTLFHRAEATVLMRAVGL